MERIKGVEPLSQAWKALALPLSYTRTLLAKVSSPNNELDTQANNIDLPKLLKKSRVVPMITARPPFSGFHYKNRSALGQR